MPRITSAREAGSGEHLQNVQRIAVLYASGTTASVHAVGGVGLLPGGNLRAAGGLGASTNASLLAAQLAPPTEPKVKRTQVVLVMVIVLLVVNLVGDYLGVSESRLVIGSIIGAYVGYGVVKEGLQKRLDETDGVAYRTALTAWQRRCFCHRCGATFEIGG